MRKKKLCMTFIFALDLLVYHPRKREMMITNEKRLIDANALIEEAYAEGAYGYVDALQIAIAPTVDAVEVVRCRECKYFGVYRYSGNGYCTNDNGYGFPNQKPDDFCSRGERKCNA